MRHAWGRFKRIDDQITKERKCRKGRQIPIDPSDYAQHGATFIPERARYDYLVNLPEGAEFGRIVDEAMDLFEAATLSLSGILPRGYDKISDDLLTEVLRIFNNEELHAEGNDIIGRIYEFFLGKFAPTIASDDGVFFASKPLVRMIMNTIESEAGTMIDPACGSDGMFVGEGRIPWTPS